MLSCTPKSGGSQQGTTPPQPPPRAPAAVPSPQSQHAPAPSSSSASVSANFASDAQFAAAFGSGMPTANGHTQGMAGMMVGSCDVDYLGCMAGWLAWWFISLMCLLLPLFGCASPTQPLALTYSTSLSFNPNNYHSFFVQIQVSFGDDVQFYLVDA